MLAGDNAKAELALFNIPFNKTTSSGVNDHPDSCPKLWSSGNRSIRIFKKKYFLIPRSFRVIPKVLVLIY